MTTITPLQYITALELAHALGHAWAGRIIWQNQTGSPVRWSSSDITPERIREVVTALFVDDGEEPQGHLAPEMDGANIRHVSAHGSVRYLVFPDGSATVFLSTVAKSDNIAGAYAAMACACLDLVRRKVNVELRTMRPTPFIDQEWGLSLEYRISRAGEACSGESEVTALRYLSDEVLSGRNPSTEERDLFYRFYTPPARSPVQADTFTRRTKLPDL